MSNDRAALSVNDRVGQLPFLRQSTGMVAMANAILGTNLTLETPKGTAVAPVVPLPYIQSNI